MYHYRITPGEGGSPNSPGKEGMPIITEQDEENDDGVLTKGDERLQEQYTEKPKVEVGSIPVVEPLLGEQDQPMDEDGEYIDFYYRHIH